MYYFKLRYIHIHTYVLYLLFNVYLTYSVYCIKNAQHSNKKLFGETQFSSAWPISCKLYKHNFVSHSWWYYFFNILSQRPTRTCFGRSRTLPSVNKAATFTSSRTPAWRSVPFTASSATPTHACHFPIATPPARAVLATRCIPANQRTFRWSIRHCMITTSILQVTKSLIPYIFYFIIYSTVSDESSNICQVYLSSFSGEHLNFKVKTHSFDPPKHPKRILT